MQEIAFDIDGVCLDLYSVMRKYILEFTGYDCITHPNEHDIRIPNLSKEESDTIIHQIIDSYLGEAEPYHGAYHALQKFQLYTKQPIVFITARKKFQQIATFESLDKWFGQKIEAPWFNCDPPYYPLTFKLICADRATYKKSYLEGNFKYFVEDKVETVWDIKDAVECSFIINRHWNINREIPANCIRCKDLEEVFQKYSNISIRR